MVASAISDVSSKDVLLVTVFIFTPMCILTGPNRGLNTSDIKNLLLGNTSSVQAAFL